MGRNKNTKNAPIVTDGGDMQSNVTPSKYTPDIPYREQMVDELQRVSDEVDGRITADKFREMDTKFTHSQILGEFGRWSTAVEEATGQRVNRKLSAEEMIDELQRVADVLGHSPTQEEFDEISTMASVTFYNSGVDEFDTWSEAKEVANLDTNFGADDEDLLENLRELTEELGHPPLAKDVEERGRYALSTYYKRDRWSSIEDALDEAGLDYTENPNIVTKEDLIEDVRRLAEEKGREPKTTDILEDGKYSLTPYRNRWDSHESLLREAGVLGYSN